jgi:serine/threonine protein kinase
MTGMMTCPDEAGLLSVAMGEPTDDAIAQHAHDCEACRGRVEQLRAEVSELPPDVGEGLAPDPNGRDPAGREGEPAGGTTVSFPEVTTRDFPGGPPQRPVAIGKYVVVDLLDWGGEGEVYRVINPDLGKELVLKLARHPADGDEPESLVKEGKVLAELDHINLVRVFDSGLHDGRPFLVMEYVHGRNLEDYVRNGPVTPRRAAELVTRLAGALAMVHRRGIDHGDIKPRNILIDEAGEPRLIDFGLARLRSAWADPFATTWGGTLAYMAPEQARREHDRTGTRSDIFGLGAVLYFLLTGRPPFVGETAEEILDRAQHCEFDAGAMRAAGVSRRLQRICLKAMAADPADRYATAEEFERALKWFIEAPRRMGIAAGLLLALALSYAISQRPIPSPRPSQDPGSNVIPASTPPDRMSNPSPTRAAPLHGGITLWVNEPKSTFRRGLRLNQSGAVPVRPGDEVRVEAWVHRPAYLYLFWLGSDGKVAPLYPWKDRDWYSRPDHEDKVEAIELPEVITDTWELPPSAPGLETLVLLAREDSPLPRDADTTLERDLAGPRTTWVSDGKDAAVWLENGQAFGLDDQGRDREMPGLETHKSGDLVLRIRQLLKEKLSTLGPYHRAVIVPNQGGSPAAGPVSH